MVWRNASSTAALVMSLLAAPAAADGGGARLGNEPPALPIEVLHQENVAGSSGQLLMMPNGDLLAVGVFTGFVRFDQTGRILWRQSSGEGQRRHTVALPGGGFVSTGSQKALPFSLLPPGVAIKGNTDLWVGRFDDRGNPLWTRTFGDLQLEMGRSAATFEDGTSVVAGHTGNRETWLLGLSSEGRLRWEHHLPGGGSAVVALTDDEFGIVAQVPEYLGGDCRDAYDITPVKLWRFDRRGVLRGVVTVRDDAIGDQRGCGWRFEVAHGHDEAQVFVLSAWAHHHKSPPTPHLTRVDLDHGQVWSKAIPRARAKPDSEECSLSMTVLPDGDPVVACTSRHGVEFHRFDASDGRGTSYRVDPPSCDPEIEPARWFLRPVEIQALPDGDLVLAGSASRRVAEGMGPDAFRRCAWLAKLALPPKEPH